MAIIKESTHIIDGIAYTAAPMTASEALTEAPKLAVLFGDKLFPILMAGDMDAMGEMFEDKALVGSLVVQICKNAADPDGIFKGKGLLLLRDIIVGRLACDKLRLSSEADVPGPIDADSFDDHFTGRLAHLAKVAWWFGRLSFFGPTGAKG